MLNFYDEDIREACGIKGSDDFIDMKHLNTAGAYKFTTYTSTWLKEILEIEAWKAEHL